MRLIKMTGGLGNQMFIYALYLSMKEQGLNARIDLSDMQHYHVHNGYEMHRVFALPHTEFCTNQALKKVLEFLFFKTILERKQHGRLEPYFGKQRWPLVYYKGFYQNERYFKAHAAVVRQAFQFDLSQANAASLALLKAIDADEQAVSLHVRRGDYLHPKHFKNTGSVCTTAYYERAISEMLRRHPEAHFYVFSDGLDWVKENLSLPSTAVFVGCNHAADSWQDMMLMSHCRHHIICNSTFSWWGAWLNPRPNKLVLCPTRWFANEPSSRYVPDSWEKIECK